LVQLQRIKPHWLGEPTIVAASGPSLTGEVVHRCRMARWERSWRVLTVNDACRAMPWADALYAADEQWWRARNAAETFAGVCFTCKQLGAESLMVDKGEDFLRAFPSVQLIPARPGGNFSVDPDCIHYGEPEHSGFQAINLAILFGARFIVLVGFDGRWVENRSHFFGDHPNTLRQISDEECRRVAKAYDHVNSPVPIWNATPESAITRFPLVTLDDALSDNSRLHRDRAESDARPD
jgi:hypothetical protein